MTDNTVGDFFLGASEDDEPREPASVTGPVEDPIEVPVESPVLDAPELEPPAAPVAVTDMPAPPAAVAEPEPVAEQPAEPSGPSREARLAEALDKLMADSHDVQAAALVSLDGFTMASALPEGMHEDRVGAMSAAILGLGERASAELGRGGLSQVFIQGDNGYVILTAAGDRAVLTCLADTDAKLGLVLYDMRETADTIAKVLS